MGLEAGSPSPECLQDQFLPKAWRENVSKPLSSFWGLSATFGGPWWQKLPPDLCLHLHRVFVLPVPKSASTLPLIIRLPVIWISPYPALV